MLTITHTHADGTLIDGSRPNDGVWEVLRALAGWKCGRRVGLYVRNSRDRDADRQLIDRTAAALRAAGHDVAEDIDNTPRATAEREADRAERADRRAGRYAERAGKAAAVEQAHRAADRAISDRMPLGEPIKIGHHSERAHRRAFEKMDAHMRKAIGAADKARNLAQRAESVGHNLEHRNDPRVTMRRIERLKADARDVGRRLNGYRSTRGDTYTAPEPGSAYHEQLTRRAAQLAEEIAHWQAELAKLAEVGAFVAWGPDDFRKGDRVNVRGQWVPVRRVNKKSVSVPGGWGMVQGEASWNDTIPWDDVAGRRRDSMQLDTPNGEPWPVELAQKVARWSAVHFGRRGMTSGDNETRRQAQRVLWAQRIAHGLDLGAAQSEVDAFQPHPDDIDTQRAMAAAYLEIFDRLTAGESAPDIAASLPAMPKIEPEWTMPEGEPQRLPVREVKPGDVIAGVYDRGLGLLGNGEMLLRSFAGPVAEVIAHEGDEYSGERFIGWWLVNLATRDSHQFKPWQMLAVHRAEPVAEAVEAVAAEPAAAEPEPAAAERWQALVAASGDRPHSRATHERIRRQHIARRRVCGVPDDYVGADFTDLHPGTYEEKAAAYLAAYAALLAADGIGRTHPAEPEPTPDVAPPAEVLADPTDAEPATAEPATVPAGEGTCPQCGTGTAAPAGMASVTCAGDGCGATVPMRQVETINPARPYPFPPVTVAAAEPAAPINPWDDLLAAHMTAA